MLEDDIESSDISLLNLPNEIINKILQYCAVDDLCKLSNTCRKFRDLIGLEYLWYLKWKELVQKSGLGFPHVSAVADGELSSSEETSFQNRCRRLWLVCHWQNKGLSSVPVCIHCGYRTCTADCLDTWERKVTVDIGSKTTWLLTTTFALQRHPSVLVTPESRHTNLPNHDSVVCSSCTSCEHRKKQLCLLCTQDKSALVCRWCFTNRLQQCCSSEEDTLPLSSIDENAVDENLFSEDIHHKELSNDSVHYLSKISCMKDEEPENVQSKNHLGTNACLWSDLQVFFQELYPDCEVISPVDCFIGDAEFHILEKYIEHLLGHFNVLEEIQKPNVSFVFCEPFYCTLYIRRKLTKFFLEKLQMSRVCFLNKALSTASLVGLDTCLVIDSGASNTVVTLIIDGEVQTDRTRHCPVGGTAIAQYLGEAITCNGIMEKVSIPSLDTSRVKSCCYLSYNIAVEEKRKTSVKHSIFVRCRSPTTRCGSSKLEKLELGSELYLAPEVMYSAMELPAMVHNVVEGLEADIVKEALKHILLTGSNTELNGFATRLIRDLQEVLPDYSRIINVHTYAGSRSWDSVMGSTRIIVPFPHSKALIPHQLPGSTMWITREDYILHGNSLFDL